MDKTGHSQRDSDVAAFQAYASTAHKSDHKYLQVENGRFKLLDSNEEASTFQDVFKHAETLLAQEGLTLEHRNIIVKGMNTLLGNFETRGSWIATFFKDLNRPVSKETQILHARDNLNDQKESIKNLENLKIINNEKVNENPDTKLKQEVHSLCKNKEFMNNLSNITSFHFHPLFTFLLQKPDSLKNATNKELKEAVLKEVKDNFGDSAVGIEVIVSQYSDSMIVRFTLDPSRSPENPKPNNPFESAAGETLKNAVTTPRGFTKLSENFTDLERLHKFDRRLAIGLNSICTDKSTPQISEISYYHEINITDAGTNQNNTPTARVSLLIPREKERSNKEREEMAVRNKLGETFGDFAGKIDEIQITASEDPNFLLATFDLDRKNPEQKLKQVTEGITASMKEKFANPEGIQDELNKATDLAWQIKDGNFVVSVSRDNQFYNDLINHSSHFELLNDTIEFTLTPEGAKKYVISAYQKTWAELLLL